mmetsp:Transcript_15509/g.39423  ORF Transcript_15509/g.39423 Transcript_15509/m.39423 type:complete len:475 (-) Transcript_15509:1222-2646(-)
MSSHSSSRLPALTRKKATQRAVAHASLGTSVGTASFSNVLCSASAKSLSNFHEPSKHWSSTTRCNGSVVSGEARGGGGGATICTGTSSSESLCSCSSASSAPSKSTTSRIISSTSSSVNLSPRFVMTCRTSAAEIKPLPSRSKTLKASMSSSSVSVSPIFRDIKLRNSGKSMVPFPSASTSLIMSCNSASVGFWPRERNAWPNSLVHMIPSPRDRRGPAVGWFALALFITAGIAKSRSTAMNEVSFETSCKVTPSLMALALSPTRSASSMSSRPATARNICPAGSSLMGICNVPSCPCTFCSCKLSSAPAAGALSKSAAITTRSPVQETPPWRWLGESSWISAPGMQSPVTLGAVGCIERLNCRITFCSRRSLPATNSAAPPAAAAKPSTSWCDTPLPIPTVKMAAEPESRRAVSQTVRVLLTPPSVSTMTRRQKPLGTACVKMCCSGASTSVPPKSACTACACSLARFRLEAS